MEKNKLEFNADYGKANADNSSQSSVISAKISAELFDFIENYRWTNRKSKTDIVIAALNEWAVSRGYTPQTGGS